MIFFLYNVPRTFVTLEPERSMKITTQFGLYSVCRGHQSTDVTILSFKIAKILERSMLRFGKKGKTVKIFADLYASSHH